MTNEQREAIEYLKESVLIYKNTIPRISNAIETALNLIKQQERKILDYDEIIARLEEENTRKDKLIIEQLKEDIRLQKENEEKDITIDIYIKELDKIYEVLNIERGVAGLSTDEIIKTMKDTIQQQLIELKNKDKRINDLEFALIDMVMQFANRVKIKGSSYVLDTMGLSTLELAFNELGFDEMYPVNKADEKYKILEKKYYEN